MYSPEGDIPSFFGTTIPNTEGSITPPECNAPLVPINEDDEACVLFNSIYSSSFPDKSPLIPDGVYPTQLTQATNTDKQSVEVYSFQSGPSVIPNGSTV